VLHRLRFRPRHPCRPHDPTPMGLIHPRYRLRNWCRTRHTGPPLPHRQQVWLRSPYPARDLTLPLPGGPGSPLRCTRPPVHWGSPASCSALTSGPPRHWRKRNLAATCHGRCWPASGVSSLGMPAAGASTPLATPSDESWAPDWTARRVSPPYRTPTTAYSTATPCGIARSAPCSSFPPAGADGASAARTIFTTPRWPLGATCAPEAPTWLIQPSCKQPSTDTTTRRTT